MTESTTSNTQRDSRNLPEPIFDAIIELEDKTREATRVDLTPGRDSGTFIRAVVATGAARDRLARLLLDAGVKPR
jgi:hypothetical protein